MQNRQEREIDLIAVLYRALKEWRKAIACGVILGLLFGAFAVFKSAQVLRDEEKLAAAQATFEIEHLGWEAEETTLKAQMENLRTEKSRQLAYNQESILMKIDPLNEYAGTLEIYVDSEYKISPELTFQNIDYTNRILSAYSSYLTGGELYDYILEKSGLATDRKYIQEILSCTVDYGASNIIVTAIGSSEKDVSAVLELVKAGFAEKYEVINSTVSSHKYAVTAETLYTKVDFDLEDRQKENRDNISVIDQSMQEVNAELIKWKAKPEPQFEYEAMEIFKEFVKKGLIGGIAGVVIVCGYYCVAAALSGKYTTDNLAYCTPQGTKALGIVYEDRPRRRLGKIDRLIARMFGKETEASGFAESCALVGSNISNIAKTLDSAASIKIALVGKVDPALAASMATRMGAGVCYAGDITSSVAASEALSDYDYAVIAAAEDRNSMDEVSLQWELLKGWGKEIIGVVTIR